MSILFCQLCYFFQIFSQDLTISKIFTFYGFVSAAEEGSCSHVLLTHVSDHARLKAASTQPGLTLIISQTVCQKCHWPHLPHRVPLSTTLPLFRSNISPTLMRTLVVRVMGRRSAAHEDTPRLMPVLPHRLLTPFHLTVASLRSCATRPPPPSLCREPLAGLPHSADSSAEYPSVSSTILLRIMLLLAKLVKICQ